MSEGVTIIKIQYTYPLNFQRIHKNMLKVCFHRNISESSSMYALFEGENVFSAYVYIYICLFIVHLSVDAFVCI